MIIVGLIILLISAKSLHINNAKFYDQQNREIYFRGPSVVMKVPPYIPLTDKFDPNLSFSEEDMKLLRKWGYNSIRLGLMWAGVEPSKDTYNQTYLAEMVKIVNKAGQYGIYTLIDFHQDILAEKYCGDGVPTWLIDQINGYKTFPFPVQNKKFVLNSSGLPDYKDCLTHNWPDYYFSLDVGRGFHQLYTSGTRLNTKFTMYWQKIATTFKHNPNVIAYQLINQPFVGRAIQQPWLLIPSVAERLKFQSFYDKLADKIRHIDSITPICFEPITFDNSIPIGFSHPPGGNRFKNVSVLCYHYYKPPALNLNTIDYRVKDAQRLGIPAILSEMYGSADAVQYIERAETLLQSWMFWNYKDFGKGWGFSQRKGKGQTIKVGGIFNPDGIVDQKMLSVISTSYMQLVAGKLISSSFRNATKQFVGVYLANPKGNTILYYNKQANYPNGYNIQIHPSGQIIVSEVQEGYLKLFYPGNEIRKIMVVLTKK